MVRKKSESGDAPMLMATTDTIPGDYEVLGVVQAAVQTGSGWLSFSSAVEKHLSAAYKKLEQQTRDLGGDAVIGLRYSSSAGAMLVAGTAIRHHTH